MPDDRKREKNLSCRGCGYVPGLYEITKTGAGRFSAYSYTCPKCGQRNVLDHHGKA